MRGRDAGREVQADGPTGGWGAGDQGCHWADSSTRLTAEAAEEIPRQQGTRVGAAATLQLWQPQI